jgi:hypothetical protein
MAARLQVTVRRRRRPLTAVYQREVGERLREVAELLAGGRRSPRSRHGRGSRASASSRRQLGVVEAPGAGERIYVQQGAEGERPFRPWGDRQRHPGVVPVDESVGDHRPIHRRRRRLPPRVVRHDEPIGGMSTSDASRSPGRRGLHGRRGAATTRYRNILGDPVAKVGCRVPRSDAGAARRCDRGSPL